MLIEIAALCLIVASITDLKHHIIPNELVLVMIGASVVFRASMNYDALNSGIAGLFAGLILGILFWIGGAWAGGDAKLIAAIGSNIGFLQGDFWLFMIFCIMLSVIGSGFAWYKSYIQKQEQAPFGHIIAVTYGITIISAQMLGLAVNWI